MDQPPAYIPYSEFAAVRDERDRWAHMYLELVTEFQQYKQTHPEQSPVVYTDSCIFTKKAKIEHREMDIIASLQASMQGRKDKARALSEKVRYWQDEECLDRNYNAQILYDELLKLISIPFSAANFRKFYHHWSSVA